MADSGVREIQLSGKQLVFFFMASVVLIVAVFLLGVSVGRGARVTATDAAAADLTSVQAPQAAKEAPFPPPIGGTSEPTTYPNALRGNGTAANGGKTAAAAPQTPPPAAAPPPSTAATSAAATQSGTSSQPASQPAPKTTPITQPLPPPSSTPATSSTSSTATKNTSSAKPPAAAPGSWYVQTNSFRSKDLADSEVAKLHAKGYQAFISDASKPLYSVRVGPYPQRADAAAAAEKLKKDGFQSLVTR